MTYLLIAFLAVAFVPLLIGSWRVSLVGLAMQGLLMAWMALLGSPDWNPGFIVLLADLALLRGLLAPELLSRALKARKEPARNEVIPANLLYWFGAGALVGLAFGFARRVADGEARLPIAVAAAALLLGLFVLATEEPRLSQIVGLLRIENAIALFELASPFHLPLLLHVGMSTSYAFSVALYLAFLSQRSLTQEGQVEDLGRPTL